MGSISIIDESLTEEKNVPTYGVTLQVPNVQEIVRGNPLNIPERYIRNQEVLPKRTDSVPIELPVIDLSLLSNGNKEELKRLDLALKELGFVQLISHGVAKEVLQNTKETAMGFFNLPLEEKNKFSMQPNDVQGYGYAYVMSDEQKLDWSDALILITHPSNFRKYKFWPTTPKEFRETIDTYSNGVRRVAKELLGSVSLLMGMEKNTLLSHHKEVTQALRVNYYPPCCDPEKVLGISPHTDKSSISVLFQGESFSGLEIKHDGEWVAVKPIPNSLVANVGDVIEIWSNGKYKSIEHRAVTNEKKARMSLASFLFPHEDVEIGPLDQVVESQGSLRMYDKVKHAELLSQCACMTDMDEKTHAL